MSMIGQLHSTWRERTRNVVGLVIVIGFALMNLTPALAQPPIAITACGKISKAGLYEVDANLVVSTPAAGDCLIITAPNVSLNLNNFDLFGATSSVGIHVMKNAARAVIEGNGSTIQTFGVGIQIDAPGALVDNVNVILNSDAGILLNKVQLADLSNFYATGNKNDGVRIVGGANNVLQMPTISGSGRFGVWIQSSSHNSVGNFDIRNNALAGIYVGCSQVGPQGSCTRNAPSSDFNNLFSGTVGIFSSGVQQYGVAIDEGDSSNRVINVRAWENNQLDLLDVNPDCGTNYWFAEPIIGQVAPLGCIN
jgi:hypothetical protein